MLAVSVDSLRLIGTAWADDLPRIGYLDKTPVKDLVAKRYGWVTIDGPYACATESEARKITGNRTNLVEVTWWKRVPRLLSHSRNASSNNAEMIGPTACRRFYWEE
jgi:hypothetical protein